MCCVIGLDLGTSRFKGVLVDSKTKQILASAERTVRYLPTEQPGRMEIDPKEHRQCFISLLRELTAQSKGYPVQAIACASAAGNTLLLDPKTGMPLTPVISWLDARAQKETLPALAGLDPEKLRELTGWPVVEIMPTAHLAWLLRHEPEKLQSAFVSQNHEYLLWFLTGVHAIDLSSAVPFRLVDQLKESYAPELIARFGLTEQQLPQLVDVGTEIGHVSIAAGRETGLSPETRVFAGCFDHPAAARGENILAAGELLLSCGTSWVGFFPCRDREKLLKAKLLIDPFLRNENMMWGGMFSIPGIGLVIDEYVKRYIAPGCDSPMRRFDELAAAHNAGSCRIDLEKPFSVPDGTPGEAARAVMESAARLLNRELDRLKPFGIAFHSAVMVGGPSRSPVLPDIIKAETSLNIRIGSAHSGAFGAAMIAAHGLMNH